MKALLIILNVFIAMNCYAKTIKRCGSYHSEGFYGEIKEGSQPQRVIILNRGSNSEIFFYIRNKNLKKLIPESHLGVNFKLKLKFISSCYYYCEGEILEVINPLDPFDKPKSFTFPRPEPIRGTEIECKNNSIEN